jgi:hypothetical protein
MPWTQIMSLGFLFCSLLRLLGYTRKADRSASGATTVGSCPQAPPLVQRIAPEGYS